MLPFYIVCNTPKPPFLILLQSNHPHIDLIFGVNYSDNHKNFQVSTLVATVTAINTVSCDYIFALVEAFPQFMHRVHTTKQYAALKLSGIVKTDSTIVTTDLNQLFKFELLSKTATGTSDPCTNMFTAGKDMRVNLILGPFLQAMQSSVDLCNGIVDSKHLDIKFWHINFKQRIYCQWIAFCVG